jgi:hypothetical protein
MWRARVVAAMLWIGGSGVVSCVTAPKAGYRLYEGARGDGGAANLYGPIARVDGVDVSDKGQAFELRPTCHAITLSSDFGQYDSSGNGGSAKLGELTFALQMQDGFTYVVERRTMTVDGNHANVRTVVRAVSPDGSSSDLDRLLAGCR